MSYFHVSWESQSQSQFIPKNGYPKGHFCTTLLCFGPGRAQKHCRVVQKRLSEGQFCTTLLRFGPSEGHFCTTLLCFGPRNRPKHNRVVQKWPSESLVFGLAIRKNAIRIAFWPFWGRKKAKKGPKRPRRAPRSTQESHGGGPDRPKTGQDRPKREKYQKP